MGNKRAELRMKTKPLKNTGKTDPSAQLRKYNTSRPFCETRDEKKEEREKGRIYYQRIVNTNMTVALSLHILV